MPFKKTVDTLTPLSRDWRRASSIVKSKLRKAMEDAGKLLAKEGARRAPVMKGNLEESIKSKVVKSTGDQIKVEVTMGGVVDGVNVDAYAAEMHESHGVKYKPGEGTIAKQAADPSVRVGRKFLERALEDNEDDIVKALEEILFGEIS